ncbi:DUF2442 domain-containing protein [Candidatus Peregrinibacteria bacterium]|nr:DUF2442 domain-containing protein [Candidatus Peregrinibacteria bacterium]MBI3816501.1 DUF2442 domain-containing protein [Candidatus Peregrinibacteria bacterium]
MMKIQSVQALPDMKVHVVFADGIQSTIDLSDLLSKGIAQELRDPSHFKTVRIDSGGGIEWDNGFDICPNVVRERAKASR